MAAPISLTDHFVTLTAASAAQAPYLAADVGQYDILDLNLWMAGQSGTANTVQIWIQTNMTRGSSGWIDVSSWSISTGTRSSVQRMSLGGGNPGFARFVRWRATLETSTPTTFLITGMGRTVQ